MTVPNDQVFSYDNLPVMIGASTAVFGEFSTPSHQAVWTPRTGRRIFLTGIEISPTLPLVVTTVSLERAGNTVFLVARFSTTSPAPFVQSLCSPLRLNINESVYVSSTIATVDVTLFGFEQ